MGWTSKPFREATHTTLTGKQAFQFLKEEFRGYEFAMFHFKKAKDSYDHNECYMVMRSYEKMKNFILCVIIDIKNGEIYWKEIEESMYPNYDNCPVGFFQFVKAPNKFAEDWRAQCAKKKIQFKPITEFML